MGTREATGTQPRTERADFQATADRLVLVDDGTAKEFDGSIDDYIQLILGNSAKEKQKKANKKDDRKAAAEAREKAQVLKKDAQAIERDLAKLTEQRDALDAAIEQGLVKPGSHVLSAAFGAGGRAGAAAEVGLDAPADLLAVSAARRSTCSTPSWWGRSAGRGSRTPARTRLAVQCTVARTPPSASRSSRTAAVE